MAVLSTSLAVALVSLGGRREVEFGLLAGATPLPLGQRLGVGAGVVVDARPRVVDFRVTPPAEVDRDLVARVALARWRVRPVREVVLLQQRALVGVGHPALVEATAHALVFVVPRPEVRTVGPVPRAVGVLGVETAGHGTPEVVGAQLVRERGVAVPLLDRVAAPPLVCQVVTAVHVVVGVVDPHVRPLGRLRHISALGPVPFQPTVAGSHLLSRYHL